MEGGVGGGRGGERVTPADRAPVWGDARPETTWRWLHHSACLPENPELCARRRLRRRILRHCTVRQCEKRKKERSLAPVSSHPSTPSLPAPGNHWPTFHAIGIPQHAAFRVWLLSVSITFPRSICIVGVGASSHFITQ